MSYPILLDLATGIATNEAVNAWCQEHYGRNINMQTAIDQKRPPSPADVPFAAFSSMEAEKGLLAEDTLYFEVLWGVASEGKTTTGNLTEYDGARLSDELGTLIAAALERVEPEYTVASGRPIVELATPWFPLWCGILTLTVNLRR